MSTLVTAPVPAPSHDGGDVAVKAVTQRLVLRSEWVKMRSLRSTTLTLAAAVGLMTGAGWMVGALTSHYWSTLRPDELLAFSAVDRTLIGFNLAQLAVGVLGVLLVTGEYATGMIRATFGAVPRRLPVLWAKASLYAGVTFALMLVAALVGFLGGQLLLGSHGTTLSAPGALQGVVGVAVYLMLIGVFAVALGFVLRSTAGGVASLFGLLMVLPGLGLLLPSSWQQHLLPYLPSNAGMSMISTHPAASSLSASGGLLVLLTWVAAALAVAAVLVTTRDA
jgi:ABC-2 type transport system permease protein